MFGWESRFDAKHLEATIHPGGDDPARRVANKALMVRVELTGPLSLDALRQEELPVEFERLNITARPCRKSQNDVKLIKRVEVFG